MMNVYLKKNYLLGFIFFYLLWVFPTYAEKITNIVHIDRPVNEVPYLEFPEETIELIDTRRQAGLFDKIEYGCYHTLQNKKTYLLLFDIWCIGTFAFFAFWMLIKSSNFLSILFFYAIFCLMTILPVDSMYDVYQYPGFWLLTDKGILLVKPGYSAVTFFLKYDNIVSVDNIRLPGSLSPANSFLRITTKDGMLLEYTPDLFANERVFLEFSMNLKKKIEEHAS